MNVLQRRVENVLIIQKAKDWMATNTKLWSLQNEAF